MEFDEPPIEARALEWAMASRWRVLACGADVNPWAQAALRAGIPVVLIRLEGDPPLVRRMTPREILDLAETCDEHPIKTAIDLLDVEPAADRGAAAPRVGGRPGRRRLPNDRALFDPGMPDL